MSSMRRNDVKPKPHCHHPLLVITVLACALSFGACQEAEPPGQNVTEPVAVKFDSHGSTLHGAFFPANADPPVATVLLLHGYPGNNSEPLGLGTRLMREGINALAFNYRGTWASEGEFDPDLALEDVGSAMSFLTSPAVVEEYGVDADNVFVAGTSFGGAMALAFSAQQPLADKVIAVAALDFSRYTAMLEASPDVRGAWIGMMNELTSHSEMVRGPDGETSFEWMVSNAHRYDPVATAGELATRDLLLIGGWRDTDTPVEMNLLPLIRALQTHGAERLTIEMLDDGHDFVKTRDDLAARIILWIKGRA